MRVYISYLTSQLPRTEILSTGTQIAFKSKVGFGYRFYFREAKLRYLFSGASHLGVLKESLKMFLVDLRLNPVATLTFLFRLNFIELEHEDDLSILHSIAANGHRSWISRQAILGGVRDVVVDECIDYDYSRRALETSMRIWSTSITPHIELGKIPVSKNIKTSIVSLNRITNGPLRGLLEVQNARVLHGCTIVEGSSVQPLDRSQLGTLGHWPSSAPVKTPLGFVILEGTVTRKLSEAIFVGHSQSWYHFIVDILPRYLEIPNNLKHLQVILPKNVYENLLEILRSCGFTKFTHVSPFEGILIEKLHTFVDQNEFINIETKPQIDRLLRLREVLTQIDSSWSKPEKRINKLLIVRPKNVFRKIENMPEIISYLETLGFKSVSPELLSFKQQKELFQNADVIVGESGAALTSLIFCKPSTKVYEIHNHGKNNSNFWRHFSENLGLSHVEIYSKERRRLGTQSRLYLDKQELSLILSN